MSELNVTEAAAAPSGPGRAEWRVIILASLGGALEFYDFVIYSLFAQYIGRAFFPASDPVVSLTLSFAVFGVGYLARPFGGLVLSHFGDRYGRRRVFIVSMLVMSASTVGMGLLPGYAAWGMAASLAMIMLRIVQGFCLGGELPGAITYVVETAPRRAGLAAGFIFFCVNSGVVLASLLCLAIHAGLSADAVGAWGWRIGFLVGGATGLISFWLRLSLRETAAFAAMHSRAGAPAAELLRGHAVPVLVGFAAIAGTGGFNGLLFAMPAFLPGVMHYTPLQAIQAENVCLAVLSVGLLSVAWLGDRVPRRRLLGLGGVLIAILAYPFFNALQAHSAPLLVLAALAGLVASLLNGSFAGAVADLFPTRVRFSGIALSLNLAFSIFSGLAPLAAAGLARASGRPAAAAYYMMGCAALTAIAALFMGRYDGRIRADFDRVGGSQSQDDLGGAGDRDLG